MLNNNQVITKEKTFKSMFEPCATGWDKISSGTVFHKMVLQQKRMLKRIDSGGY